MNTVSQRIFLCGWCLLSALRLSAQEAAVPSVRTQRETERMATYYDKLYEKAIQDVQTIKRSELSGRLWSVDDPWVDRKSDSLVQAVVVIPKEKIAEWTGRANRQSPASWDDAIWVTLSPELSMVLNQQGIIPDSASVNLRIKQLLGLPPRDEYCYVAQCWVPISGLVRPTPDPDVHNHFSTVTFPEKVDSTHRAWIEHLKATTYTATPPYPWTSLGYTYDWGNSLSPIGLSEFVIRPNTPFKIIELSTIWCWYLQQVDFPTELFMQMQKSDTN